MRDGVTVPSLFYHGREGGSSGWGAWKGIVRNIGGEE